MASGASSKVTVLIKGRGAVQVRDDRQGQNGGARLVMLLIAAVALAGCRTTATPDQTAVASSEETAPAGLQQACASEAATRLNGENDVLPISSVRDPNGTYRVGLQLSAAGQAVCVIDQNGVIQTIEKV